jgi:hypothetical protein
VSDYLGACYPNPRRGYMETEIRDSIIEHFSSLRDPRIVLKTDHKLINIVVITVCALLAGADEWTEVAGFGKAKKGLVWNISGIAQWNSFS